MIAETSGLFEWIIFFIARLLLFAWVASQLGFSLHAVPFLIFLALFWELLGIAGKRLGINNFLRKPKHYPRSPWGGIDRDDTEYQGDGDTPEPDRCCDNGYQQVSHNCLKKDGGEPIRLAHEQYETLEIDDLGESD